MDLTAKKKALRTISGGLFVATSRDESGPAAATINWISQSSFMPPMVMVAFKVDSRLHQAVAASRVFIVHTLGKSQREMAIAFFKGALPSDGKLNGYAVETGENGAPLLADAPAWIECRVIREVPGGDHTVMVAEVLAAGVRREEEPLTLRESGFSYGG